jgi:hypothetical protein
MPTPHPDPWQGPASPAPALRGPGVGPLVLLVPIFALLAFTLWRQAGGGTVVEQPTSTERPPSERGERVVDGWAGSFTVPGAAPFVVEARLTPLHAVPERQAFDAAALAERLGLPEGEPWRLALTARADAVADPEPSSPADMPGPTALPLAALALSGFRVLTGSGDGPQLDPLRALLAPPRGGLAPGQRVDLMFWRPAPTEARSATASEPSACTLSVVLADTALEVALTPTRLAEPGTSASLARLPKPSREERSR